MHELHKLKDMLCEELEEYGSKSELTTGTLDVVDKLAHTIKNLQKIIEKYEDDEYSGRYAYNYRGGSYNDGMMYDGSYADGRGRTGNVKRDSMGRYARDMKGYSRHGDMVAELHELMQDAPDERTRMEFQKFIQKIEQM